MALLPELNALLIAVIFLILSVTKGRINPAPGAQVLSLLLLLVSAMTVGAQGSFFSGAYRVDLFSQVFKVLLACGLAFVLLMLDRRQETEEEYGAEFYMFLTFSVLGLMMLVSSVELISIVISLEVSSYSLYVILPLRKGRTRVQIEGSIKYLFFGAISTGVMLYGMGYLYGLTGSTFLVDIGRAMPSLLTSPAGILAIVLTMAGFFFKLSLFPLHFWAPDVYEGASNSTTSFIATVPKIAAAALLIRVASLAAPGSPDVVNVLIVLAALSMTFGNLVGLVQKDIKRLLAYSGIAHAGYLMLGILALSGEGKAAAIFYSAIYLIMNLACLYVVIILSKAGENVTTEGLVGLSRRAPLLALTLAVSAFSLAGIPPTGGFTGKLFLLTSAFRAGHLFIVIVGAVNTVLSVFYYLNLVRMSYSKETTLGETVHLSLHEKALCVIFILLILYMGIIPYGLFSVFKLAV